MKGVVVRGVWCTEGSVSKRQWPGWSCTRENSSGEGCVPKYTLCVVCCAPWALGQMSPCCWQSQFNTGLGALPFRLLVQLKLSHRPRHGRCIGRPRQTQSWAPSTPYIYIYIRIRPPAAPAGGRRAAGSWPLPPWRCPPPSPPTCGTLAYSRVCPLVWCGVVWCGVVWCGVVWCGVVWCGGVWCGVVWCGVVWCGVVWCGVVWCGVVWCGVVWRGVVWCGVVWYGVVWCGVVWCGVVWCGVPKALLPKGKGRDVYPRVKVNGLGCVCCVRAVCKCVVA